MYKHAPSWLHLKHDYNILSLELSKVSTVFEYFMYSNVLIISNIESKV